MKYSLENKKVLLVAPQFFGYEEEIRSEIERRGARVDFLLDRPFTSPFLKAVTRWRRQWVMASADQYYHKHTNLEADYDYVFVINGQTLSAGVLELWRSKFGQAKFFLYMWDSFGNRKDVISNLRFFDHAFTFDRSDASSYGIHFRPLFFSKGFEALSNTLSQWDISFIGTAHTDRYAIVSKVAAELDKGIRPYWYLFLQAPWVYWLYRVINPGFTAARLKDFSFSPLSKSEVQRVFFASRAVLDIEHPRQTGLTMRTLETLGARKKLITTNANIQDYDFYSSHNICVIDRRDPTIPPSFLQTPYVDVDPVIYQRYRLEGWLDEILGREAE
ncbi:lipopolysaccharide biosynthesis protein [Pseudomonas sp. 9Ag]|uniref:lipopolysaccharide biosynthesis protein n=1 Tax=Pseudomonas sp. 9Ag TaxID=2653167 RepID=UPI0012F04356|nr:lipopolysaccharide biosynthesis protein [Pseudomonas sp. 9Ag]VXC80934.1 conserved hypothetical protein [Pseudomonas sp. 9Ag]